MPRRDRFRLPSSLDDRSSADALLRMTTSLSPSSPDALDSGAPAVQSAVTAFVSSYKDRTRIHTESDLNAFLHWCEQANLDPLAARRVDLELYLRWMQITQKYKPSTVSRRMSVAAGFYRTCVVDGVLEHSPAEYVRRPRVPAESPTLGFSHLQSKHFSAWRGTPQTPTIPRSCACSDCSGSSRPPAQPRACAQPIRAPTPAPSPRMCGPMTAGATID